MQRLPNSSLRNIPTEKGKGIAGTILFHTGLFIILFVVSFSVPLPDKQESGILINFGFDDTGSGLIEPSSPASQPETAAPIQSVNEPAAKDEALLTQNFDNEAPEIKKANPDAERKKQEQVEAEKRRLAELEAERIKQEEEQKRVNEIMNRTKNALAAGVNTGTDSKSEGIAGGQGNQGAPEGSPDSKIRGEGSGTGNKGISYNLGGRGSQLLPPPRYNYQGEGRVVVEVSVDRAGNVVQALPGVKGSTTLDEYLLNAAKEAALKAKFEPDPDAPSVQKGTITYNFVLK